MVQPIRIQALPVWGFVLGLTVGLSLSGDVIFFIFCTAHSEQNGCCLQLRAIAMLRHRKAVAYSFLDRLRFNEFSEIQQLDLEKKLRRKGEKR